MGHSHAHRILKPARGFTLIEMLIVLAIIIIVTGIAVGGQTSFDRTLTLNNTAYTLALTLREAQTYGLSSRAYAGIRNTGYGVSFLSGTGNASTYTFFADTCQPVSATAKPDAKPGNGYYDPAPLPNGCSGDEKVTTYTLNNGFSMAKFCARSLGSGAWSCSSDSSITALDIIFTRPESEAVISAKNQAGNYSNTYTRACISIQGPTGETRTVTVTDTGQVAVSNLACPGT